MTQGQGLRPIRPRTHHPPQIPVSHRMKSLLRAMLLPFLLLATLAQAQVSGPLTVNGPLTAASINGDFYVNPALQVDLVTQVNTLFAACPRATCVVHIPRGTYVVAAGTIHMTSAHESLIGDGRDTVFVNYAGTNFLDWRQTAFEFVPAGEVSGFTILCTNPAAHCISAGNLVAPRFERLNVYSTAIQPDPAPGATSEGFTFQNTVNWMERWSMRDVNVGGFTKLIHFAAPKGGTDSFGYGQMDNVNLNVTGGAEGIVVDPGAIAYHLTRFQVMFNIAGTSTKGTEVLHIGGALTGTGFSLTGENTSLAYTLLHIACGGAVQFDGDYQAFGDSVIDDCPGPAVGAVPHFFIRPGSGLSGVLGTTGASGTVDNWGVLGHTVTFFPTEALSWTNPYITAGRGYIAGPGGKSAPVEIYDPAEPYCFAIKPSGSQGLPNNRLAPTTCVNGAGDWLSSAYTATGMLPASNQPSAGLDYTSGAARISGHGPASGVAAQVTLVGVDKPGTLAVPYAHCGGPGNVADCTFNGPVHTPSISTATPAVGTTCTIAGFITLVIDGTPRKIAYCQ